jgi:hypothetical protein
MYPSHQWPLQGPVYNYPGYYPSYTPPPPVRHRMSRQDRKVLIILGALAAAGVAFVLLIVALASGPSRDEWSLSPGLHPRLPDGASSAGSQ